MALVKINESTLPPLTHYAVDDYDIDSENTGRNEEGVMLRDVVRLGVFKLELEWQGITSTQLATIQTALDGVQLNVTFTNENGTVTKTMYKGDRHREVMTYRGDAPLWLFSVNLIEV